MQDLTKKMARAYLGRVGMVALDVMDNWQEVIGAEFYDAVQFQKITFPLGKKKNGVLMVLVTPGVAPIIKFEEKNILQRANRYFGYTALTRMAIKQRS